MPVNGRDCSIVMRGGGLEAALPYSEETVRERFVLLKEEAPIEGDGCCRVIRKSGGAAGCVVAPLTMGTAPLLLWLALGGADAAVYVSETQGLHRRLVKLLPAEESIRFDVEQERGESRLFYGGCVAVGFELRIVREQAVKLKVDIRGEQPPAALPCQGADPAEAGERFMGDRVVYRINGAEHRNIYGFTIASRKAGGTRTEARIHRALQGEGDFPGVIDELTVTAVLLRDRYEERHYGLFRLRLSRLALMSDETAVDCADAVIGPLRYCVAGAVNAEVFANSGEALA